MDKLDEILGAYGSYLTGYNDHKGRYDPIDLESAKAAIQAHIDEAVNEAKQEIADQIYIRLGGHRDYMSNNSVDSFQALAEQLQSKSRKDSDG